MTAQQLENILRLIESRYPNWQGFADPRLAKDELDDKRVLAQHAQDMLQADDLKRLMQAGETDEMLGRFKRLGQATNLLYTATPNTGDLSLLSQGIEKGLLCAALWDLLHGPDDSPARLGRFAEFAESVGASAKWAFATYFLFITHPITDILVKPTPFKQFLEWIGASDLWSDAPSQLAYASLLQACNDLKAGLAAYGAKDMVDVQSAIWVAASTKGAKAEANRISRAKAAIRERKPVYQARPSSFPLARCAAETGIPVEVLQAWLGALQRKRQAIVYGPPGTGKTFVAQKLAQHLADGDGARIEIVQFHPAYSYEDFVQGIRPVARADGKLDYPVVDGRFVQFCKAAQTRAGASVLIIDEINRANVSRVLGELMFLLEYRDQAITLASGERFAIPHNVLVLGTMNTADRSIALVDHALRRRFAFLPLRPNYALLRQFHLNTEVVMDELIRLLQQINAHIGDANYHLGHSFFLIEDLAAHLPSIWQTEIEPYLEEFFFDKPDVVEQFRWASIQAILLRHPQS